MISSRLELQAAVVVLWIPDRRSGGEGRSEAEGAGDEGCEMVHDVFFEIRKVFRKKKKLIDMWSSKKGQAQSTSPIVSVIWYSRKVQ